MSFLRKQESRRCVYSTWIPCRARNDNNRYLAACCGVVHWEMLENMHIYKTAVIGGGPAGSMAAIRASGCGGDTVLIEKNDSIGKKILITGKGRCNVTNTASVEEFVDKFGKQGRFLRTALYSFDNNALMDFLNKKGLELKIERQGRVFPSTERASSVVDVFRKYLEDSNVKVIYNFNVLAIKKEKDIFRVELSKEGCVYSHKVIIAMGGSSFPDTGSSGDGYRLAKRLGHTIIPLKPGLVPLTVKEGWIKDLQGLSLKNVCLKFVYGKKKIISPVGECMYTHFGVSGPLVLDLSAEVVSKLKEFKTVNLYIDYKPGLTQEMLEKRLIREFKANGTVVLKNYMRKLLPHRLVAVFMHVAGLNPDKQVSQINQKERRTMIEHLKGFPLTINGALSLNKAMITNGGVATKEINPRTMESKIVPGLYFAGEIIDGCAQSGGYNLQQAFSTGHLAGENAGQ